MIATGKSELHFWDLNLKKHFRTYDINNLPFKLYSVEIISLEIAGDKLMVVTKGGDVI